MRWKRYITSLGVILILRFMDLYLTYRYTPDLTCEWNPLVSMFGISWGGFIVTQLLIIGFVAILMFFYFSRKPIATTLQTGLSFNDFIYVYFFGKVIPWPQRLFSMPTNPKVHLHFNGFIFMVITILLSLFAITNNLLLLLGVDRYIWFLESYSHTFFPVCFAAIIIVSAQTFFTIEYRKYLRNHPKPSNVVR